MSKYVSEILRQQVAIRANFRCEYCLVPVTLSFFEFHLDHIISVKHGGKTELNNLACSCQICNLNKGPNIATYLDDSLVPVRLFHPRRDIWKDHFDLDESGLILSKTQIGEATIKVLDLNHEESLIERKELIRLGLMKF